VVELGFPVVTRAAVAFVLAVSAVTACNGTEAEPAPTSSEPAGSGTVRINVGSAPPLTAEVAASAGARSRGLMDRDSIPAGAGMVFVFPEATTSRFWMYRTRVPLSIAFVNGDRVVSTAEMQPCRSENSSDCPTYGASGPYNLAIEAAAGHFAEPGVRPGDLVRITGSLPSAQP
jgi:uncharacterized membrane protein (UPF0127 family)